MAKKAVAELPQTSQAKSEKGLTLIEVLIAIAIIASVIAIGVPRLGRNLGTQLRSVTRKIIILNKQIHHHARLKNKTYRLVIDLGKKDENIESSITLESASGAALLADPEATPARTEKNEKQKGPFSKDADLLKKPIILPQGVRFEDVEVETHRDPIKEGKAYIYFFPQGLVTKAIIHITDDRKLKWSLIVNPLTAQTTIQDKYVYFRDLE
ncbi:MAG: prepilin-type N-terminal cleavage/methylation domain-containing protein [Oligoflexia bacterium]|nr:prepilin-type N-terminal cleavage/methylation domain-containing protein [Oligoflexia bacterium]